MPEKKVASDESLLNDIHENHPDWLSHIAQLMIHLLMDIDIEKIVKAKRGERTPERTTHRNGHRERLWTTRLGDMLLKIPKLRQGTYFPSFLEPRRRAEKALFAVLVEAYVQGISTRRMERVCHEMGIEQMDRNAVSRMTKVLGEEVEQFRNRRLEAAFPYLILDARYETVREHGRMVKKAVLVAVGIRGDGHREVLGVSVGASESETLWKAFLESLVDRGLHGVMLVISDAHKGLQKAIERTMLGAAWQWCRVHFLRAFLSHVNKKDQPPIAALVKTIFAQKNLEEAKRNLHEIAAMFEKSRPELARLLETAEPHILAYMMFPPGHWTKLHSTNMIERLMRTLKARTRVVSIFPDDDSLIRLVGAVLVEENDEWTEARRYISELEMAKLKISPAAPDPLSGFRRMIPESGMAA